MALRAGVDIGGTFTDLIVVDDQTGAYTVNKTLTTPEDPSRAIETVLLETGMDAGAIDAIIHGTTLVTNALLERKGDRTALLATKGFRDALEIGRESRYDLYDLDIELPKPLVPRHLRFDVPERTLSDGSIHEPLDTAFVERLTAELAANDIKAIAVSFLHSYANGAHEQAALAAIRRVSKTIRVSLSSKVSPTMREFERTSTTVANVYVQARVEDYLLALERRLVRLNFRGTFSMMLSNGGLATTATATAFPIRLLESGPAAGALAAANYGKACGEKDLLSFDMGGTTAKFCVIAGGAPQLAHGFEFDRVYRFRKGSGLPASITAVDLVEIGAGGGSIARVNSLGLLKVGPDSVGADPGPACYGRGGTMPTVTDADLVLGYLDPSFFLGGRMVLDVAAARAALNEHVAVPLNLTVEEAAWGVHAIVNETMASAARAHVLERGKDPSMQPLFVFGGAGPVHGYRLAQALGSPSLIAPLGAGVMSAVGFLTAPHSFDFARSLRSPLSENLSAGITALREMEIEGRTMLGHAGFTGDQLTVVTSVDMRYAGQGYEIEVPFPPGCDRAELQAAFEAEYQRLYGRTGPPVPLEIVTWRVVVRGPVPELRLTTKPSASGEREKGRRPVYFPETRAYVPTPVLDRYGFAPGDTFGGPAIFEERESTLIVGPGAHCTVDAQWNLVVQMPKRDHA